MLPLFPSSINISVGSELLLECHSLGQPDPSISWILPDGQQINSASLHESPDIPGTSARVVRDTQLHIPTLTLADSGSYSCRAENELGEAVTSTEVKVVNKPLRLDGVEVGGDRITVAWRGAIPRTQMTQFQLVYRNISPPPGRQLASSNLVDENFDVAGHTGRAKPDAGNSDVNICRKYSVKNLHSNVHSLTLTSLRPATGYEVCLVFQCRHYVHCMNYTTAPTVDVPQPASGITRVSKSSVAAGMVSVVGLAFLTLGCVVARRMRHRKDYQDPLAEEEKLAIPLEGLNPHTPGTPITSSRTALLTS